MFDTSMQFCRLHCALSQSTAADGRVMSALKQMCKMCLLATIIVLHCMQLLVACVLAVEAGMLVSLCRCTEAQLPADLGRQ